MANRNNLYHEEESFLVIAPTRARYRISLSFTFLAHLKSSVGRKCGQFVLLHSLRLLPSYPQTVYTFRPICTVLPSILQAFTLNLLDFDIP